MNGKTDESALIQRSHQDPQPASTPRPAAATPKKLKAVGGEGEVEKLKQAIKKKMTGGDQEDEEEEEISTAPTSKVYQKVEMSSKCENGICFVKECFDGKCKNY